MEKGKVYQLVRRGCKPKANESKSNIKGERRDWRRDCFRNLAEYALVWAGG